MEKARILEAQGIKTRSTLYEEIINRQSRVPGGPQVARARQARAQGNWGAAYKDFAQALKDAPQDMELLNELEDVRQQMRPQMASRGFPGSRGNVAPKRPYAPGNSPASAGNRAGDWASAIICPPFCRRCCPSSNPSPSISPTATSSRAASSASAAPSGSPRCCPPNWVWNTGNINQNTVNPEVRHPQFGVGQGL